MRLQTRRKKPFKSLLIAMFWLFSSLIFAQQGTIKGKITDVSGVPIIGASVTIETTNIGAVTDIDGNFVINKVPVGTVNLTVKYVGYLNESRTIDVAENQSVEVSFQLIEDLQQLSEVVVIGYGTQKKSDLTGAVTSVKAEELTKIPTSGIEGALQGKAAGVQVSQNNGAPGANVKIRVRGISSMNTENGGDPIWIVDGVPALASSVNANDIESFEILKDASSAAIYGSNGANGVILITTKKGKAGKPQANISYTHGFQSVPNHLNMANSNEFARMYTEYQALKANGNPIAEVQYPNPEAPMPSYDYQKLVFRNAAMDNLSFSASGGSDKLTSYFGIGYLKQEGILKSTDYTKLNLRFNNEYKVTKWLTFGENASYTQTKIFGWEEWEYNNEYVSPVTSAITVHPYLAPYDSTGNWSRSQLGNVDPPMAAIDLMNKEKRNYSGNGTFYVAVEPIKGLSYESRINARIGINRDYTFSPTYWYGAGPGQNNTIPQVYRRMDYKFDYLWQNLLTYNTTILNSININVVLGHESGETEYMDIYGTRRYIRTEQKEMRYFDASTDETSTSQFVKGGGSFTAGYSYLGRLGLDYKGKYLAQLNFRKDYSSRFGPENRSGFFPGFSVGWKFSEENFVKNNLAFLSFGKLRYALGRAGNNAVRDYAYYATIGNSNGFKYSLTNTASLDQGAAPDVLPNLSIHWEDIETSNYGVDLGLFNSKLNISVDRFMRHNIGMLIITNIPSYAGWTSRDLSQENGGVNPNPIQNVGKITNKGWEFTIGWKDNIGEIKFSVDVNYTYVRNVATNLGIDSIRRGGSFLSLTNFSRTETGGNIGDFYGYQVEKIFQLSDTGTLPNGKPGITNQPYTTNAAGVRVYAQKDAQPGDFQFKDSNGDGKLNADDQTIIGNPFPKHMLGINLNVQYGWFDLTMFWQGNFGNQIMNWVKYYGFNQSSLYNWNADYVNDHYRAQDIVATDADGNVIATYPANTSSKYPRLDPINKNGNFDRISSFYVEDGSFLRLRNIQLAMTLPAKWVNKLSVSEFKVFVGGTNLLTFTKYTGMDPEVAQDNPLVAGIDKSAYPQAKSFNIGASIKF